MLLSRCPPWDIWALWAIDCTLPLLELQILTNQNTVFCKLTNHIAVFCKLTNHNAVFWKLTNQNIVFWKMIIQSGCCIYLLCSGSWDWIRCHKRLQSTGHEEDPGSRLSIFQNLANACLFLLLWFLWCPHSPQMNSSQTELFARQLASSLWTLSLI